MARTCSLGIDTLTLIHPSPCTPPIPQRRFLSQERAEKAAQEAASCWKQPDDGGGEEGGGEEGGAKAGRKKGNGRKRVSAFNFQVV